MTAKNEVSHFSAGDWVDYVRGLLSSERSLELRSHLDQQCPECLRAHAFWAWLAESLLQEPRYEPPVHFLQAVGEAYVARSADKHWESLSTGARWAELVFDSFKQPVLAFVRGRAELNRHLVYEATPFLIDFTLKIDASQNSLLLTGQVLNSTSPDRGPGDVAVVLLSGKELIAKTAASESGEFALQCEAHPNLSLFISVRGEQAIGITLSEFVDSRKEDDKSD